MSRFNNFKHSDDGLKLEFDMYGFDTSMANALRRTVMSDILNTGFNYEPHNTIKIIKNTTALHDEFLSHRIGLIPVIIPGWFEDKNSINLDNYEFRLCVTEESQRIKNGLVTTDDFKLFKLNVIDDNWDELNTDLCRNCFIKNPVMITRFPKRDASNQELKIVAKITKGTHGLNAGFSPVTVCSVVHCENYHRFMVESVGLWKTRQLIESGFDNLVSRCDDVIKTSQQDDNCIAYQGKYLAVNIVVVGETHTMGNMIQEWIYNKEFGTPECRKLSIISHISYHEPHPLENRIIFRIGLVKENRDFEEYRNTVKNYFADKVTELKEHLRDCRNDWINLYKE